MKSKQLLTGLFLFTSFVLCSCKEKTREDTIPEETNESRYDNDYIEKVRTNATTFHKNFSAGAFDKNGALVNEKIYVNSNNAIVIGREDFVQRIKRFHTPFPGLRLLDKIVIVDENEVGLLYIMQGTQDGSYGSVPASGNKINVYAAEFFTMDEEALMKELLTITQLDQLKEQISGKDKVTEYERVVLLPIKNKDAAYKKMIKANLDAYAQNFNTRDWKSFEAMFAGNADITINGASFRGVAALIDALKKMIAMAPDMTFHQIRNVAEGDRGAIAYEVDGAFMHAGKMNKDDQPMKTVIRDVKQGIHFQFDDNGKIIHAVIVFNSDDLYSI